MVVGGRARAHPPGVDLVAPPACAASCIAQAITFGDINNPENQVAKMKAEPRNYGVLEELNTRPRTTYLASVRNPNPELEPASGKTPAESRGTDAH